MVRPFVANAGVSAVLQAVGFALAYFGALELGQLLYFPGDHHVYPALRPAAGLLLAALILSSGRAWPVLLVIALLGELISDLLLHDGSWLVSTASWAATGVEASVGAWLLRRAIATPISLARIKDVLAFATWSALVTGLGATADAGVVLLRSDTIPFAVAWRAAWLADAVGVLAVAPLVLTANAAVPTLPALRPWRALEFAAMLLGMLATTEAVYGERLPPPLGVPIVLLPFLLWGVLRFGPPGAAAVIFIVATVGVWNVSQGRGPFTNLADRPDQQMLRTQGMLCVASLSLLILAAAVAERVQTEKELQRAIAEIKTLQGMLPICAWCKRIRDDQDFWHTVEDYITDHTGAQFTHGMCPECLTKAIKQLNDDAKP